jgi:hypothetical protein
MPKNIQITAAPMQSEKVAGMPSMIRSSTFSRPS